MHDDTDFASEANPDEPPSVGPRPPVERRSLMAQTLQSMEGNSLSIELRDGREVRGELGHCDGQMVCLTDGFSLPVAAVRAVTA